MGDFNGDDKLDLVVTNNAEEGGTPSVSLLLGKGEGRFETAVDYRFGIDPSRWRRVISTEDGKLDMVVADVRSSQIYVLSISFILADQLPSTTA